MLRRDYILRMIEEFMQVLSRINSLKQSERWQEASGSVEDEFQQLLGADAQTIVRLSETELLAKIVRNTPTQAVRDRTLMVATLLSEAGDIAIAQDRTEDGRACYVKGLDLLLNVLGSEDVFECPEFVPNVELLVSKLQDGDLPPQTLVRLMQHYEQSGQFGKAEDALFSMLQQDGTNSGLLDFGLAFYRRLATRDDTALAEGNLPRSELEAGLGELESKKASLGR